MRTRRRMANVDARFAFVFVALMGLGALPVLAANTPPNVILIVADDQGWTGTSVQMDPSEPNSISDFYQTPNLERLAQQGMRFSNAYSSGPNCLPTRAAIQTGKSPAQLQFTDSPGKISGEGYFESSRYKNFYTGRLVSPPVPDRDLTSGQITIAEQIKTSKPNYKTAHFGKWHLSGGGPGNHGYDVHDGATDNPQGDSDNDADPKRIFSMTRRANEFMEARVAADEPFFMQVSHYAVHTAIQSLQETTFKYRGRPSGKRHFLPTYAAMTENLDSGVGMLLNKIDELGIADDTYLIYVSDNGGLKKRPKLTNNFPLAKGKGSIWEGGIRVPMVVRGAGIQANSISHVPVTTTDLFPTISDLLGIDARLEEGLEGGSLREILENGGEGAVDRSREALFWHFPHYELQGGTTPASAVRLDNYKLLKFYETGELMLFDLAQDLREANDLADAEPEKRDQMHQMLNDWIEQVDASIPYKVGDNVELSWDADYVGTQPNVWRATTDVQHRARESWTLPDHRPLRRVAIEPHQPHLSRHAFQFDGSTGMTHRFFHVSDPATPVSDNDHSASFEFWLRLDSLEKPHMLFETGRKQAGLSVTIGDGDGDRQYDELRFRALRSTGQFISLTTEFDLFTDPTRDFVQLVAVFSDNATDRYADLYVNGALFRHVDGINGEGRRVINWDDWGMAGLGLGVGGIGGNAAGGPLPFEGGLDGELAFFRYYNYAINTDTVRTNYNDRLDDVDAGVVATSGAVRLPLERPSDVSAGAQEGDRVLVIHERTDTLDDPVQMDILPNPNRIYSGDDITPSSEGFLSGGTVYRSYLVHFDPLGDPASVQNVSGSVSFAEPILGILVDGSMLDQTDALLGAIGRYPVNGRTLDLGENDFLLLSDDLRTLTLSLSAMNEEIAQLRVLTVVPEPSSAALLLMILSVVLLGTRRREVV